MFKDVEREEDEDYELEKMAAVIKSKGGKLYRNNLDDDDDDDDNESEKGNLKKPNKNIKVNQKDDADDDETTDSDSESEISEAEDQSAAIPINEWDDKPVLTPAGKEPKYIICLYLILKCNFY